MEENILLNEEVIDLIPAEDIMENVGSKNGFKTVARAGAVVLVGFLTYKYVAKPLIAKHKAKKNQPENMSVDEDDNDSKVIDIDDLKK